MKHAVPPLREMMQRLIGTPSVSSVNPTFDQSNREVIDLLAGWLEGLGFAVEVLPLTRQPGKTNLIATLGRGEGGARACGPYRYGALRRGALAP